MDPSSLLTVFFSWQFVAFCVAIFAIVECFRRPMEAWKPGLKFSKLWSELLLVSAPVLVGALLGLCAKQFPAPPAPGWTTSASFRLVFGIGAGFNCGWIVRIIKGVFLKKAGVDDPDAPASPKP